MDTSIEACALNAPFAHPLPFTSWVIARPAARKLAGYRARRSRNLPAVTFDSTVLAGA